ncbi:hypothetical protein Tco_0181083 [Tanacetum coccineum]
MLPSLLPDVLPSRRGGLSKSTPYSFLAPGTATCIHSLRNVNIRHCRGLGPNYMEMGVFAHCELQFEVHGKLLEVFQFEVIQFEVLKHLVVR